jgi:uncharacterized protein YbaP (TraB family)
MNNKYPHIRKINLILLFASIWSLFAIGQDKPGIFYSISGNGLKEPSYIYGTYHLIKDSYLNCFPTVKEKLSEAKGVVVEVLIDSSQIGAAREAGMLKDKTLSSLLPASTVDSLDAVLKESIGVGIAAVNNMKPMNITLTLSLVHLLKSSGTSMKQYTGDPLDQYFAQTGKANGKKVTALESIDQQMNILFNSESEEEQVKALRIFLNKKTEMLSMGDSLLHYWLQGDLNKMYGLAEAMNFSSSGEDYLIKKRNLAWMEKLPELMQQGSTFIAVGALHLAGPWGLTKLLTDAGYTITPIKL